MENKKMPKKVKAIIAAAGVFTIALLALIITLGILDSKKPKTENRTEEFVVTDDTRYVSDVFDKVNVQSDLVYGTEMNYKGEMEDLKLDVYTPDGDTETNRPLVIYIHGGSFTGGDKAENQMYVGLLKAFAKKGYVAASINYRLGQQASYDTITQAVADSENAIRWLQDHSDTYGIDKNHVAIIGYSAGAVIAQHLGYSNATPKRIDNSSIMCVIDVAGMNLYYGAATKSNPPCLAIHGTKDLTDPYAQSENFIKMLQGKGIDATLYTIEGLGHDLSSKYNEVFSQVIPFIYKQLTGRTVTIEPSDTEASPEYQKIQSRIANQPTYGAKQIDLQLDGKLDEWTGADVIQLNQIKDQGNGIPDKNDFSGNVMIGWNEKQPSCIYIGATILDDVISDNDASGKWYANDCLEIAFDRSTNSTIEQFMKWVVGANDNLAVLATKDNTQISKNRDGNTTTYEIIIDINKISEGTLITSEPFAASPETTIGFSICYNDSDGAARKSQIGWTAGKTSERSNFGNLTFIK
jgi:acetyl esterase/lipase